MIVKWSGGNEGGFGEKKKKKERMRDELGRKKMNVDVLFGFIFEDPPDGDLTIKVSRYKIISIGFDNEG